MYQNTNKKLTSAGAIIFRRENKDIKYLLLHFVHGHWGFARGGIEKGEEYIDTALREIKEETGLTKKDLNFIPKFQTNAQYYFQGYSGKLIQKENILFLAETKKKEIELSHEHTEYVWLSFKDAHKKLAFKTQRKMLKDAHNFLGAN
ncbi:bis(5'-nucleosyl)-tetraphosphatase [Patescibacteria group bacterium]